MEVTINYLIFSILEKILLNSMKMSDYLIYRFGGYEKIGFINRLFRYPTFAIVILDSEKLSQQEKEEFKKVILKRYMNDTEYRISLRDKCIIFSGGKLHGVYSFIDVPRFILLKGFYVEYPYVDKFVINTERFPWEKF